VSKQSAAQLRLVRSEAAGVDFTFSEEQEAACSHRGTPLIITGRTGTGKTRALIEAAVSRIKDGQSPDSILLLTYGRDRASELRDAIVIASNESAHEPLARTFHSLAYSILKMRTADQYRDLVLMSGSEQETLIADLLEGDIASGYRSWHKDLQKGPDSLGEPLATQGFVRELRDLIMRANERGITPTDLALRGHQLGEKYWEGAADFWNRYLEGLVLQESLAGDAKMRIDPSEIINLAKRYLTKNPELLAELRARFTTIIVDEFQESDPSQRALLELLAGQDLIIVADTQSAVGRFRGADPEGVAAVLDQQIAGGARKIEFTTNFRGTPQKSTARLLSESEEAHFIAHQFKRAHLMQGVPYSQMAVIVRSHGQCASAIRRAFAQVAIPVAGDIEALANNAAIAPFLLLARIATGAAPLNLENAEKLLTSEFGGATSVSLRRTRAALLAARDEASDKRSGTQLIIDAIKKGDIAIEDSAELMRVHNLLAIAEKSIAKRNSTIHDLLWAIWNNAVTSDNEKLSDAWRAAALRGGSRGAAADRDLDAMIQLFDTAARHIERFPGADPELFLKEIENETIVSDVITSRGVRPDVVEVLTVHSTKGRQWQMVAVAGVQEGSWPNLKQRSSLLGAERLVERVRHGDEIAQLELDTIAADSLAEDEARLFHVATTRASNSLLVTAISREDETPSIFFEDFADALGQTDAHTKVPRPLTAPALVATLRREVNISGDTTAAGILKTLSTSGIHQADPTQWLGSAPISSDLPVVDAGQPVSVSPSGAENFNECGLKWFLEKSGGTNGDSTAQLLGSVIHEFARLKVDEPATTDLQLTEKLIEAWPLIDDSQGWISTAALNRAKKMLERFAQYHRESTREVVGAELNFTIQVGRATIRGNVDRVEVDADGKFYIIDFKTGKNVISKADAQENLQLACYQLGVILDGFEEKLKGVEVAGSELVFLANKTQKVTTRVREPIDAQEIQETIEVIAEGMGAATFTARKSDMCSRCPVKPSCPLHLEGRAVHQ
jgi:superfamily I DNA/RNA helicase/RecB family exonuclease